MSKLKRHPKIIIAMTFAFLIVLIIFIHHAIKTDYLLVRSLHLSQETQQKAFWNGLPKHHEKLKNLGYKYDGGNIPSNDLYIYSIERNPRFYVGYSSSRPMNKHEYHWSWGNTAGEYAILIVVSKNKDDSVSNDSNSSFYVDGKLRIISGTHMAENANGDELTVSKKDDLKAKKVITRIKKLQNNYYKELKADSLIF